MCLEDRSRDVRTGWSRRTIGALVTLGGKLRIDHQRFEVPGGASRNTFEQPRTA
jgi:hypothetical protein